MSEPLLAGPPSNTPQLRTTTPALRRRLALAGATRSAPPGPARLPRPVGRGRLLPSLGTHALDEDLSVRGRHLHALLPNAGDLAGWTLLASGILRLSKTATLPPSQVVQAPGAGLQPRIRFQVVRVGQVPVDAHQIAPAPTLVGGLRMVLRDLRRPARAHQVHAFEHGLDPQGKQLVEVEAAQGVVIGDLHLLLHQDRPLVEPGVRPEDGEPGPGLAQMTGQLMELPPRCRGSREGWYWMEPCAGNVQHLLRARTG